MNDLILKFDTDSKSFSTYSDLIILVLNGKVVAEFLNTVLEYQEEHLQCYFRFLLNTGAATDGKTLQNFVHLTECVLFPYNYFKKKHFSLRLQMHHLTMANAPPVHRRRCRVCYVF